MKNNQAETNKNINQEIDKLVEKERKLRQIDRSYRFRKSWKAINIFFYASMGIGFVLFLFSTIFFTISKDYDLIKVLGMVFGFLSLGLSSISWLLFAFLNSPIKTINKPNTETNLVIRKQNKLMLANRILFFSLTIVPTLMLVLVSNVFGKYPQPCLIVTYFSLVIFALLVIAVIIINLHYQKTKKQILVYIFQTI